MKKDILNTYLDRSSINSSSLKVFYSFTSGENDVVWNDVYTKDEHYCDGNLLADKYPGLSIGYTDTPSHNIGGSGYFTKNDIMRIGSGVTHNDWALFMDFGTSDCNITNQNIPEILVSSMAGGTSASGFNLGINNANKLFIEYNHGQEKIIETLDKELSNFNVVSLSYNELQNQFGLTYHDFPNGRDESLSLYAPNYVHSNVWHLGGMYVESSTHNGYSGHMDDFLFFNNSIDEYTRNKFSEAFFVDEIVPPSTSVTSGYVYFPGRPILNFTGVVGTKVTGYECASIMSVEQKVGNDIPLYGSKALTGALSGTTLTFGESGSGLIPIINTIPEQIIYNTGEVLRHSNKHILFKESLSAGDIYEFYLFQKPKVNLNKRGAFEVSRNVGQLNNTYEDGENINLYINGVGQVSGSSYELDELNILSNGYYDFKDFITYDKVPGETATADFPGNTSDYHINSGELMDEDIYLNGQKLISGLDYSIAGSSINLWPVLPAGELSFMARAKDITAMMTGNSNEKINTNSVDELVWLNGVKQVENIDYYRVNDCSLSDPSKKVRNYSSLIYNNNGDYFNI
tara:strand:- start:43959 stop:45674 length:1716 start_codon:yes stop_codon:yes gene_type:complete